MSMEELMNFFQGSLEKDFGYSDDHVIESLRSCADELRRAHMGLPPPPSDDSELPSKPFGVFVTPTIEQIIGRQSVVIDGQAVEDEVIIPADGGPVIVPIRSSMAVNHHSSSVTSSSVLDHYDTATDGMSSRRISIRDGHSSVTSLVDEFLDVSDDIGNMTPEVGELQVESVEVDDDFVDTQQWPWSSSMPYITSAGPMSRMTPAPAVRTPPSVSPMSDTACISVGRNMVGMVSLNQPVSLVTVVADGTDTSTPTISHRLPSEHYATAANRGPTLDAGVRDFFAPNAELWSHHIRSSPYPPFALPSDRHPSNTRYQLHALKSARDVSRQRYFSSSRVDGKDDSSCRSRPNGLSMQVAHHQQPGATSAPAIGNSWPGNNGWSMPPSSTQVPGNTEFLFNQQPVINVRSRVLSSSGNQVGSKVIFPVGDVSSTMPYMSSVSPPLDSQAKWTYRL